MQVKKRLSRLVLTVGAVTLLSSIGGAAAGEGDVVWRVLGNVEDGDQIVHQADISAADLPLYFGEKGQPFQGPQGRSLTTTFLKTGEDPEGDSATAAGFTTDGQTIVIAHRESENLILFDADTRDFVAEIALSGSPNAMAISPDGVHAITANIFEGTASIVNLVTQTEDTVVTVGGAPGVAEISPDGLFAAIGNFADSSISVIEMATGSVVRTITGIDFVASLSANTETFSPTVVVEPFKFAGNSKLVHGDYYGDVVNIINIATGNVTALPCSEQPRGVATSPDGTVAVLGHGYKPSLTVVDPVGESIVKTITLSENATGPVCVNATGTKAVVAIQNACVVVDLATDAISSSINTASVYGLLPTADGLYALGVGYRGSLISFTTDSLVKDLNNQVSTPVGAVSPVEPRAALCSNSFGEDLVVVNTNGSSGFMEEFLLSGPPPEGDKCRTVAVSEDGSKVAAVNVYSDNVTVFDVASKTIEGFGQTGQRPSEVALTSDGSLAVVGNMDSYFVTVIDMDTLADTTISIGRRAAQIEISPDDQYAYIAVVADGDGVYRLNLDTLALEGSKLPAGNMGGVYYLYSQSSGMTLSHDGSLLAIAGTYDDVVTIIDTASWSVVTNVAVGDYPTYCAFSADDSRIYASIRNEDQVEVIEDTGGGWAVVDEINVGAYPFHLAVTDDDSTLYVMNYSDKNIGIIDVAGGVQTNTVPLPNSPAAGLILSPDEGTLYVASGNASASLGGDGFLLDWYGELTLIDTASLGTETYDIGVSPSQLAFNSSGSVGAIASPVPDAAVIIEGEQLCPGDLDGDGDTDQSDLGILLASYGNDDGGDLDGDGDTDQSDLGILLADYGCGG
jgi:YVTN family beta-propeller protein